MTLHNLGKFTGYIPDWLIGIVLLFTTAALALAAFQLMRAEIAADVIAAPSNGDAKTGRARANKGH